jgi:DNA-binding GntR family transcriptional regulator
MTIQKNPLTKMDYAYGLIKSGIFSGKYKFGERLVIRALAQELGTSVIPIREAITKLSQEGFIETLPHIGSIVKRITRSDVEENFIIRTELEGLATFYATQHLSEIDFKRLEKNISKMNRAIKRNELKKIGKINREFHEIIYNACPYRKIHEMIRDLWEKLEPIKSIFVLVPKRARLSLGEHEKILKALRKRDAILAQSLIKDQKRAALIDLEAFFNSEKV